MSLNLYPSLIGVLFLLGVLLLDFYFPSLPNGTRGTPFCWEAYDDVGPALSFYFAPPPKTADNIGARSDFFWDLLVNYLSIDAYLHNVVIFLR